MKTAISLPDNLYSEAEKVAEELGIPRSQLFAKALEEFIQHHNKQNITEKLDLVYSNYDENQYNVIEQAGIDSIRKLTKNDSW